ncbi:MAG TPA: OmpH family outer membrane protein [Chitinophagaceae bacterium]|nr:OmpH family outer membrane protein [Chitinophagaceae bacterium]
MKKGFFFLLALAAVLFSTEKVQAQQLKIGVFDIDNMVTAMPGYRNVDSLLQIYQNDSLATEYSIYANEYKRLDSTWKADSAAGKPKAVLDYTGGKRQEMYMNLAYWQQIAQTKYENKRSQLAKPLYEQVYGAYKKVVSQKKYALVLKPGAYEPGNPGDNLFPVDNLFISVAKELKLTSLPQELLYLGGDPDAPKTGNTIPPKTNPPAPNKKP